MLACALLHCCTNSLCHSIYTAPSSRERSSSSQRNSITDNSSIVYIVVLKAFVCLRTATVSPDWGHINVPLCALLTSPEIICQAQSQCEEAWLQTLVRAFRQHFTNHATLAPERLIQKSRAADVMWWRVGCHKMAICDACCVGLWLHNICNLPTSFRRFSFS